MHRSTPESRRGVKIFHSLAAAEEEERLRKAFIKIRKRKKRRVVYRGKRPFYANAAKL